MLSLMTTWIRDIRREHEESAKNREQICGKTGVVLQSMILEKT